MSSSLIGSLIGSYRIIDSLGQGGMASVYRAYHARLDRYVAIKMMHPAFREDSGFMTRFQREAQIVARLEHPNIVPVYDYSDYQGQPYLVMKYIEGQTLKSQIRRGPLPLAEIARILAPVSSALTYAHRMDVLHRDIKPSNILMERDVVPYLADFGLARLAATGESTLSQDMILGTPQYMSPEQAQGVRDLDARADIYSLGIVLYEMLTGQVPFNADSAYTIIHDHIYEPLPLPSTINKALPPQVDQVVSKALAKVRTDRYDSANALAAAFDRALKEAGVDLPPVADFSVPGAESFSTLPLTPPIPGTPSPAKRTPTPPIDSSGVRTPVTPFAAPTPPFAAPTTLALDPTPAARAFPPGNPAIGTPPVELPSAIALRSLQLHRLNRRRNLWIAGGFSGLLITLLAGLFVVVGALNDPNLQVALLNPPPSPSVRSGAGSTLVATVSSVGNLTQTPALTPLLSGTSAIALLPTSGTLTPSQSATPPGTLTATSSPSLDLGTPHLGIKSGTLPGTATPFTIVTIPLLSVPEAQAQVSAAPNNPVALFALSLAEFKARQSLVAQTQFENAVKAAGDNVPVLVGGLSVFGTTKVIGDSVYLAEKLLTLGPLPPQVYADVTHLLYDATGSATAGDFQNALKSLPETPELDAITALALDRNGHLVEADAFLKKAVNNAPTLPFVLLIKATIEQSQNEFSLAIQDYDTVAASDSAPTWMINEAQAGLASLTPTPTPTAT